ncbi:MAG: maleylpyruvate isomerase N-terminal domain-containing protein, partial [Anaerolineae bacterium]|nr:maleylpyruvate isomerase N-terminal domain-containing protein [Anaerolineae bacterium]
MTKEQLKNHLTACREKLMHILETIEGEDWQVQVQSEGEQWTVLQMVRHLQDAHRGLTGQVKRIAAGEPNLPPDFDIDRWNAGAQRKAAEMPPEAALENL